MHANDIIIQVCLETYTALLAYSSLQDEENLVCMLCMVYTARSSLISTDFKTREQHRSYSLKYRNTNTNTRASQIAIAKSTGVQYTLLQELDYFDCVRLQVGDPMHNLLLGTGKHALNVWIKLEIIRPHQYDQLQEMVDAFSFPSDIVRIPYKITSGFSGFTADQWTWIVILSPIILKEILPPVHYRCWSFVEACYLLCCRLVSLRSVDKADDLLLEFCTTFPGA